MFVKFLQTPTGLLIYDLKNMVEKIAKKLIDPYIKN